ncbi:HAD family hydrolase [Candidatus Neomarinimicrobiota bacterium]
MTNLKKLYLFDIDGTLLSPGPSARKSLNKAIQNNTGKRSDLQIVDVAGLTDQLIVRNVLQKQKYNGNINQKTEEILSEYLNTFKIAYASSSHPFIYQDALKLLIKIEKSGNVVALLTGNTEIGAQIKLGRFNLINRFAFGVFGNDGMTRMELPVVAYKRAQEILNQEISFNDMVIIGDTPNDARIANGNGCESIIVCRRPEWRKEILKYKPTFVVEQLDDKKIIIPKYETNL